MSWAERGHAWHSGRGVYRTTFERAALPQRGERVVVDLGAVCETAAVTINGHPFSPLAFPPYHVDVTEHVRVGPNDLTVEVANTNANAFERRERPSGLLGPARLITLMDREDA